MQLLKVQERINALPLNAASLSYLDRAAKGMDTEIPPFMALAGMNEMKRNMEYASTGQPPEEPINESLPKKVAQQMGLGQPMQPMQQGQPMQQPMQPPEQLAQGIAQPMPQQMPQQMAGGGLASVRIDPRMFDYGSGGVVSFVEGNRVYAPPGRFDIEEEDDDETTAEQEKARLIELRRQQDVERARENPPQETADVIEARRRKEGNYGASTGPLGEEYLTGLAQIQELKKAERARQAEDNKSRDFLGISNALIAAGNATRGQSGMGGLLSGFGQQAGQEMIASQERDAALRGQGITEAGIVNEAKNKVQGLRQAKLSGDVAQIVKLQSELADLANKARTAKMTSLSAEITAVARILSAGIAADKGIRPTDLASGVEEGLRAARARGDKREDDVIREEVRNRLITAGVAVTAGAATTGQGVVADTAAAERERKTAEANAERNRKIQADAADNVRAILLDTRSLEYKKLNEKRRADRAYNNPPKPLFGDAPPKPDVLQDTAGDYKKQLMREQVAELNRTTPAVADATPAAADPAAPPANLLKPGINTNFNNGQTWTLGADGQPKRVK